MSIKIMFSAMSFKTGSPTTKLVLLKLADNASDSGECWPSYENIAKVCEISKRSAINHVKKLIEMGVVKKTIRKGEKGNYSNIYHINFTSADVAPPSEKSAPAPSEKSAPESVTTESVNESSSCQNSNEFKHTEESLPKRKETKTPYVQIIDLYHELLPGFNTVRKYDSLKENIKARHKSMTSGLDSWRKYFQYIHDNCKWMSSGDYGSANKLSYIVNKSNFEDILNGGKDDRT